MDKGIRHNEGKPKWHLVDFDSLIPLVRVLEKGAEEYGEFNWKKGLDKTEISESLIRHAMKLANGVKIDDSSGFPHYAHIMANAMFYSYFDELSEKDKVNEG